MQHPGSQPNQGIKVNLSIQDSAITTSRDTVFHLTHNQGPLKDAMQILKEHVAFGALFNSKERFDPPKCHPDTRKAVLTHIDRWARDHDNSSKPIMWLRGAMGAGKSAIAQTSAELWADLNILVASFFFSRTIGGRNENTHLIATLAYQLMLSIPSTRRHIEHVILNDIGLFEKGLLHQMKVLIIEPLTAASREGELGRHVVVIDGLDECCQKIAEKDHEAQQREILEAIALFASQANCPLRFLIASRPERQIRASFSGPPLATSSQTMVLDDTQNPNIDIELFLDCSFDEIRHNHPYLGSSWPPDGTISSLVQKSSSHFIYASTAVRYLRRPRQDPRAALEAIMNINAQTDGRDSPFAELDALYILIMRLVLPESLPVVLDIFALICYPHPDTNAPVFEGCNSLSLSSLERHFFLPPGSLTYTHLVDLHSILEIPTRTTLDEAPIRFIHASFGEFLINRSRSGCFCLEQKAAVSRILPFLLKHTFVQSLQPDSGTRLGYVKEEFSRRLLLFLDTIDLPFPPQGFVKGLTTLIGEDKEVFADYVRDANLAHFGVERNYKWLSEKLLKGPKFTGTGDSRYGIEIILG